VNQILSSELVSIRETVRSEVTETRALIMGRIDRLSDVVTGMRDDIKVNFGASETVRRANEHTRDELRDTQNMVADMRRQLLSLGERLAAVEQKVA
jgi:thiamine biosynthesis protein ThiC